VKRSGRDEPIWVVIHICMETTNNLPIHLSSSQMSNKAMLFLSSDMCFFNKIGEQEDRAGSAQRWGAMKVAKIMYIHVSKCKNYKGKLKKNKL
jgi:hypothetical protein